MQGVTIINLTFLLLASCAMPTICQQSVSKPSWHFSPDFLVHYKPQETPTPGAYQFSGPQTDTIPIQSYKDFSWFSYENAQRAVNIATIIFATIQIYERYQTIGFAPEQSPNDYQVIIAIKKIIASLCPEIIQHMSSYGFFLVDSTAIVFKALVYKAIARLLLVCAYGDLSDFMSSITHGGFNALKVLFYGLF